MTYHGYRLPKGKFAAIVEAVCGNKPSIVLLIYQGACASVLKVTPCRYQRVLFDQKQPRCHIEVTSWKVRAYDLCSRVEKYRKTNERAQQRTSEFSDTLQRVNKNRTKHF